ncbi:MAG: HEAT repeat domain-containing protein [Isosphaeraceae bacterium]
MPREQLRALAADVERLIAAGAGSVSGDEGLRRREAALRELGKKVPALARLAALVGKTLAADAKIAPRAVLDLLLVVNQARAGLSTAGLDGPIEPAGPSGPWASPSSAHDLYPIADVLGRTGSGRIEAVKDAVARGMIGDLRVVDAFLGALDDPSTELADLVATDVLPALGATILPDLRRGIDPQGKAADGRRLAAIAAIDRNEGLALCRRAIEEGNATVKARAIELLARLAPDEAATIALDLLSRLQPPGADAEPEESSTKGKKNGEARRKLDRKVRDAAMACLRASTRDEALEILIAALWEDGEDGLYSHRAAHAELPRLPHPRATARLLDELDRMAETLRPADKGKKGKAKKDEEQEKTVSSAQGTAGCLLSILGERGDRAAVPALMKLLDHPASKLRNDVAEALSKLGDLAGLEAASALVNDPDAWSGGIEAAWQLPPGPRFERLAPLCEPVQTRDKAARAQRDAVLAHFETEAKSDRPRTDWDPRWADVLRPHLDGTDPFKAARALAVVLGTAAVPEILRVLADPRYKNVNIAGAGELIETLGRLRAREAIGPLMAMYDEGFFRYYVSRALREMGDPAAIPLLEAELAKMTYPSERSATQALINELRASVLPS